MKNKDTKVLISAESLETLIKSTWDGEMGTPLPSPYELKAIREAESALQEDHDVYPLTIVTDRYSGCYSGAKYHAFKHEPHEIPYDVNGDDCTCGAFWGTAGKRFTFGQGDTIQEAIDALKDKLKSKSSVKYLGSVKTNAHMVGIASVYVPGKGVVIYGTSLGDKFQVGEDVTVNGNGMSLLARVRDIEYTRGIHDSQHIGIVLGGDVKIEDTEELLK